MSAIRSLCVSLLILTALPAHAQTPPAVSKDDAFEQMLIYVYQNNPQLAAERDNVRIADEKVSQAISGFRPDLSAGAGAGRQREKVQSEDWLYGQDTDLSLTASQPLFNGFGTLAQRRAADSRVLAARSRLLAVEQSVLFTAIGDWLELGATRQVLSLTQANLDRMRSYLDSTRKRFKAGDGTQTDVAQAESRLAQAEARMAQVQAASEAANASFQRDTGLVARVGHFSALPQGLPKSAEEAESLCENNPEQRQAEYEQVAAEQDIKAAESSIWPSVSLNGTMSEQNSPALGLDRLRDDAVMVNVNIPLYQGGAEYSRVREAKIAREKSFSDTVDIEHSLRERALLAWSNYRAAQVVSDASKRASEAAQRALFGLQEEQRQGLRTLTDVLNQQSEMLDTQVSLVQSEKSLRLESYRLLAAVGRLTMAELRLPVVLYNPKEHYKDVARRWAGF